jgi:uncharacterized protein (UPF0218 family)
MSELKMRIEAEKPPRVISVGDVVSQNLHQCNLQPQLTIIDNISLRTQKMTPQAPVEKTVYVENPAGVITQEAICAIRDALTGDEHIHIVVEGEEDLLTLAAVLFAPKNSFVVYGQPHVGIVVVRASKEKKAQVEGFLKTMKPTKS